MIGKKNIMQICCFLLCITLVFLCGCSSGSASTAVTDPNELYGAILQSYRDAITWGIDYETAKACGINDMCCYATSVEQVSYAFQDIDIDGTPELFISEVDNYDSSRFMALYTVIEEEPTLIAAGTEHIFYTFCNDGYIMYKGSSGFGQSSIDFYKLGKDGQLEFVETIQYDIEISEETPLYTQDIECWENHSGFQELSDAEAQEILEKYVPQELDYTPFTPISADGPSDPTGSDEYSDEYFEPSGESNDNSSNDTLSEYDLQKINEGATIQLATAWMNDYNNSVPVAQEILAKRTLGYGEIEYYEGYAVVYSEIRYWFKSEVGSPAGTVEAEVEIDTITGKVLAGYVNGIEYNVW